MAEKYYQLGTYTAEQWCQLHQELISVEVGLADNIKVIYQGKFDQRFLPGPRRLINNLKITNGLNLKSNK